MPIGVPRHIKSHEYRTGLTLPSVAERVARGHRCGDRARPCRHRGHAGQACVVAGIIHQCVANMPDAVARTSPFVLNNATLPFVLRLADTGVAAMADGDIRHKAVAEALRLHDQP